MQSADVLGVRIACKSEKSESPKYVPTLLTGKSICCGPSRTRFGPILIARSKPPQAPQESSSVIDAQSPG